MKYLFTILTLLFVLNFTSFAQTKNIASGDDNGSSKLIKFYPNPATSAINFEFIQGNSKSLSLQLYNFMGKKVMEITAANQITNLNVSNFHRGVYIFRLTDQNGKVYESGKFQVIN